MGFSRLEYPYTGGAQDFSIDFALGILENADVTVYVIGEVDGLGEQIFRDFTFIDEGNIRVTDPLPNPSTVVIDRTVDKDTLEIDIDNTGPVTRVTLSRAFTQLMMNIHELLDGRVDSFSGAVLDAIDAVRDDAVDAKDVAVQAAADAQAVTDVLTGDVVDTAGEQTLRNKTLDQPILIIDTLDPTNPIAPAKGGHGHAAVDFYGAVGDGVTNDTTAINAALATGQQAFLSAGKTYRYVGVPADTALFSGTGILAFEEPGFPTQYWGTTLLVGDSRGRGGDQRIMRRGGVQFRDGCLLTAEEYRGGMFCKTPQDEAMLFTVQGDVPTIQASATGTAVVTAVSDTFDADLFPVDALVFYADSKYRIAANNSTSLTLANDDGGRTTAVLPTTTDLVRLPRHAWDVIGNYSGSSIFVTGGEFVPGFSPYDYANSRVMAKVNGAWYRVTAGGIGASTFTIDTSGGAPGSGVDATITFIQQTDYLAQFTVQGNRGQGLEARYKLRQMYDGWEHMANGSGVTSDGSQWFGVGNVRHMQVTAGQVNVLGADFDVGGDAYADRVFSRGAIYTDLLRPNAPGTGDVGNNNNPYQRITATRFFVGSPGNTAGGATGSFTTTDGKTVTVVGGLITDIAT